MIFINKWTKRLCKIYWTLKSMKHLLMNEWYQNRGNPCSQCWSAISLARNVISMISYILKICKTRNFSPNKCIEPKKGLSRSESQSVWSSCSCGFFYTNGIYFFNHRVLWTQSLWTMGHQNSTLQALEGKYWRIKLFLLNTWLETLSKHLLDSCLPSLFLGKTLGVPGECSPCVN